MENRYYLYSFDGDKATYLKMNTNDLEIAESFADFYSGLLHLPVLVNDSNGNNVSIVLPGETPIQEEYNGA